MISRPSVGTGDPRATMAPLMFRRASVRLLRARRYIPPAVFLAALAVENAFKVKLLKDRATCSQECSPVEQPALRGAYQHVVGERRVPAIDLFVASAGEQLSSRAFSQSSANVPTRLLAPPGVGPFARHIALQHRRHRFGARFRFVGFVGFVTAFEGTAADR